MPVSCLFGMRRFFELIVNFIDISTALWPGFTCTGIVLDDESASWCQSLSFGHEVLSLRRAANFLRKNVDVIDGVVVIGQGEEVEPLLKVAREIMKPARWVVSSSAMAPDFVVSCNDVLLMYNGTLDQSWANYTSKLTLGIAHESLLEDGLKVAKKMGIKVETCLTNVDQDNLRVTQFHWLWAES
jgi:hypothetical protein